MSPGLLVEVISSCNKEGRDLRVKFSSGVTFKLTVFSFYLTLF